MIQWTRLKLNRYLVIGLVSLLMTDCFAFENQFLEQSINVNSYSNKLDVDDGPPIIIAIIDDGFNERHIALEGFTWFNRQEIANNGVDDDGNGSIDDLIGWDVADGDSDVMPPEYRRNDFYHGTFVASVIADLIKAKLGDRKSYPFQFMYIKAVPDASKNMLITSGYAGIEYAINNGADIINNSWDGGVITAEDSALLNSARGGDIFVVNSVGNFPNEAPSIPASNPAVFGVAGSDISGVIAKSNYGNEVDLTAPSVDIVGADVNSDSKFKKSSGTSFATPLVTATAALMKLINRDISAIQIRHCLHNSATLIDYKNPMIAGKLGAGMLNMDGAIDCANDPDAYQAKVNRVLSKGSIGKKITRRMKGNTYKWTLSPVGAYKNVTLINTVLGKPKKSTIVFKDTIENPAKVLWSGNVTDIPPKLMFKSSHVMVELTTSRKADFQFKANYEFKPIDFEKRYCSGRTNITASQVIRDGSENLNYARHSECEWLIAGRENHSIELDFTALDIDKSDTLYIFSGEERQQANLLITLSGRDRETELPPKIVVKQGSVLLWFVSDNENQAQGFSLKVDWSKNK